MAFTTIACVICGTQVSHVGNRRKCCDHCRPIFRNILRAKTPEEREIAARGPVQGVIVACIDCGSNFARHTREQIRCRSCHRRLGAAKTRQWRERVGYKRIDAKCSVGSAFECVCCRREAIKTATYQSYCHECRPKAAKHRYKEPWRKVRTNMSSRLWSAIRRNKSGPSWKTYFDYSVADLMVHIQRQFLSGMSWENYGSWHIDHIVPVVAFNLIDDQEVRRCFAMTNLRPMWAKDNQRKSASRSLLL